MEKVRIQNFINGEFSAPVSGNYLENIESESAIVSGKVIPIGNKYRQELQSRLNII